MEYGLCSIIVPVYNVKNYLDDCFKSILRQSYRNYEVIIVDDGSTDGSSEICDYYANYYLNFHVFHEKNAGVSCARNTGLKKCRGEYVAFLDPDDVIEEPFLDNMIACILENKVDVSCCTYYRIKNNEKIPGKMIGGGTEQLELNHLN